MRAMTKPAASKFRLPVLCGVGIMALHLSGCDLLTVSQTGRNVREGNEAVVRGEIQKALQHYESALDGTLLSAEAHYRLGLLYEDQLKNEVGALHHFERYLEVAPQGQFAADVKGYVDRLRLVLVSRLADGTVMPAREASRLKNENLALKQQLAELRQQPTPRPTPVAVPTPATVPTPAMVVAATPPPAVPVPAGEPEVRRAVPVNPQAAPVAVPPPAEAAVRTYQVERGDTLAGIARKFYRNSGQWPKIAEANKETLSDPTKLQPGMILIIPQ